MMIYDWTREQAEKNPDHIAVTFSNLHLTYGKLESESNRLAGLLLVSGLEKGDRVGLFMDKTPESIIAMHGISKAGGIYIPLDIRSSVKDLTKIVECSEMNFLMVDHHAFSKYETLSDKNEEIRSLPWIWWSRQRFPTGKESGNPVFSMDEIDSQPNLPYQKIRNENQPAQILFSPSGKGQPKGVVITHKNISAFTEWAVSFFNIRSGDRISGYAPVHTDMAIFDMYSTFAAGAHLYLIPHSVSITPSRLSDFILENDLTQWFSSPAVISFMARYEAISEHGFPGLKRVIWTGEAYPVRALRYWKKHLPEVTFTHLYGKTETTVASSYYTVTEAGEELSKIPLEAACTGEELLVLDDSLRPVPEGVTGELYIAGKGLSPGYWRDRDKTASNFIDYINRENRSERIFKTGDWASTGRDGLVYYHRQSGNKMEKSNSARPFKSPLMETT